MARRCVSLLAAMLLVVVPAIAAPAAPQRSPATDEVEAARLAIRTKQFSEAVQILQRNARGGSLDAQYLLGLALWNGVGVNADREAARASLLRAANGGHAAAAYALAALLGNGTVAERKEAATWLARAASAGYAPAVSLQSTHSFALADARAAPGHDVDLRFEIARVAARHDDTAMLSAAGVRELAGRRGDFGRTLLFEAAAAGAIGATKLLLDSGAAVELADEYGQTPLMLATQQSNVAVTRLLLGAGARASTADKVGRTALFRAAAANLPDQIAALLAAGAGIGQADERGWTAFDLAQQRDSTAALEALRAAGGHASGALLAAPRGAAGIDATRPGALYQGWPPLAIAAARNDAADIRRRKAAGANLEATTPQGDSPLTIAIDSHSDDAVRTLLELGANPRRKGGDGLDAIEHVVRAGDAGLLADFARRGVKLDDGAQGVKLLGIAVRRGDAAMTRALLAAGISATATDATRMTPLMHAASLGDVEMIKLLLEGGAVPTSVDARGRSALWCAAAAGNSAAVGVLLAARAAPDAPDRDGTTPLLAAIRAKSPTAVERLLAAGAAVDPREPGRDPPLRVAAETGSAEVFSQLLARKPQLDATDVFGDTALMTAARNGDESLSVKLLAAGANPGLRNRERATAAELAEARGFAALAQRLRD